MTTLTMATFVPATSALATEINAWAAGVSQASSGALTIDVFHAGQLVGAFEVGDAVSAGQVDLGFQFLNTNAYPGLTAATFPFLAPVNGKTSARLFEALEDISIEAQGQTLLAASYGEPTVLVTNISFEAAADFQGARIYAPGTGGEVFANLGASVVNLPLGELFQAISVGVVDAALVTASTAAALQLDGATDTALVFPNDVTPPSVASLLSINNNVLSSLSDDLKTLLFDITGADLSTALGDGVQANYAQALVELKALGMDVETWDTAGFDAYRGAAEDFIDLELSQLSTQAADLYAALFQLIETGTKGADIIAGTDGNDVLSGLGGRDLIRAGKGEDQVEGGNGRDKLYGGNGKDVLIGGKGNDLLVGGKGADSFIFSGRFGNDRILGFDTASRKEDIDLSDIQAVNGFRDLKNNHMRQDGDDVLITIDRNSITLRDTDLGDLSKSDFLF